METKQKKSIFTKTPSWVFAIFVAIIAAIVLIISDSIMTPRSETGLISHLINDLIIAVGCFFILKAKKTNESKPKNNSESSEPEI